MFDRSGQIEAALWPVVGCNKPGGGTEAPLRGDIPRRAEGINVFPHKGRGYAPAMFEGMPEARGHTSKALAMAMVRLLADGRIWNEPFGPPSKETRRLARKVRE
jgi:hypothetical protein